MIAGPSGSGKSTLLKLMSGVMDPDSGSLSMQKSINRRGSGYLSYVPQEPIVFLSPVVANIYSPNEGQNGINEIAERLGVSALLSLIQQKAWNSRKATDNFSGGQRQRLALIRAIGSTSNILVLDEITSALDTENENKVLKELLKKENKRTVILASHKLNNLLLFDRVIYLNLGQIEFDGNPHSAQQFLKAKGWMYSKSSSGKNS